MSVSKARITFHGKAPVFVLSCMLFLQLSGLTCIQDASAYPSKGGIADSSAVVADPSPESSPGSGESLYHDCPCHHLISLPSVTIESVVSPGASIAPVSFSTPEDLPQILFHPPLVRL